jgi:hypothetical protein
MTSCRGNVTPCRCVDASGGSRHGCRRRRQLVREPAPPRSAALPDHAARRPPHAPPSSPAERSRPPRRAGRGDTDGSGSRRQPQLWALRWGGGAWRRRARRHGTHSFFLPPLRPLDSFLFLPTDMAGAHPHSCCFQRRRSRTTADPPRALRSQRGSILDRR